jgi:hypothetical protein
LGVTARVAKLRTVAELVGRDLSSTSELYRAEARRVIDALNAAFLRENRTVWRPFWTVWSAPKVR